MRTRTTKKFKRRNRHLLKLAVRALSDIIKADQKEETKAAAEGRVPVRLTSQLTTFDQAVSMRNLFLAQLAATTQIVLP